MTLQFIRDAQGNTTGVYIPIEDWQELTARYEELQQEELDGYQLPDWHKEIIDERLKDYYENPDNYKSIDEFLDEIKNL